MEHSFLTFFNGVSEGKRGAEKLMSVYWFIILGLVAVGVYIIVSNFYNNPYDVREMEANILTNKIAECVSVGGRLVYDLDNPDMLEFCSLNFESADFEEIQYYVKLEIGNAHTEEEGNFNLVSSCGEAAEIEHENLAKCSNRIFYAVNESGNPVKVEILSIVRKTEKNIGI